MPGHPDGQNYAIWRGTPLSQGNPYFLKASTGITAPAVVTNFESLLVFLSPVGPIPVTITITFYADQAFATPIGSLTWNLAKTQSITFFTPILGNFVKVFITTTDATGTNIAYSVQATNVPVTATRYVAEPNVIDVPLQSIAALTTVIFPLPNVGAGAGYWFVFDPNTTAKFSARVITLNPDGTEHGTIDRVSTVSNIYRQQFTCPDEPAGMLITNTDTVAHNITMFMAVDMR